ncbi:MAG: cytochrome c3 family protein [Thermodesulfobacteriota bacterium]|jgi:predicted CXXCH cytochrome family protein
MKLRLKWLFLAILVMSLLTFSHSYGQNKFKLKPGAQGQLCLNCHDTFKEKLKNPFVHTPVKTGDCTGCHNPHTSSHGKLLAENPNKICVKCHEGIVPQNPKSVHPVVMEGNCVKCHDPHASKYKFVLLKPGNELCLDCHKSIGDAVAKARFKHAPVDKGCVSCHDPHGSAKERYLLKNELVSLCVSCHRTDQPSFSKQHMNYPVAKSNCSSCHDAHGSNRAGILFDNVHPPVANKVCTQCHEAPTSPDALKTKRTGFELCRGCHSRMMNDVFSKNRIHWPLVDQKGCLNCHKPHASPQKNLLRGDMNSLCGKCHIDTLESQKKLAEKEKQENAAAKGRVVKGILTHSPIQQGGCDACHSSHASDSDFLLKQPSVIKLCESCHDWSKHTNHPMGEKVIDPRNKNVTTQCLSCHISHGSGYRYLIPFPTVTDLCNQCHKQYRR